MSDKENQGSSTLADLGNGIMLEAPAGCKATQLLVGRCETCKWWDKLVEFDAGFCDYDKCRPGIDDTIHNSFAKADRIETGPKFGCIHHEKK